MTRTFSIVRGFERRISLLDLPDPDDRHVLAAAIESQADVIVTYNLKDFPASALDRYAIVAQHPDSFLACCFDENETLLRDAVHEISDASRNPPRSFDELVARLGTADLRTVAERLGRRG